MADIFDRKTKIHAYQTDLTEILKYIHDRQKEKEI